MLPWMKNKSIKSSGDVKMARSSDGLQPAEAPEESDTYGLDTCAQDLIDAVHSKDATRVAQVLKDAFDILESQPHSEAEESPEMLPGT